MTQPMIDPYATLGVPRDANEQQVHEAYRRLAMRYHPDRHRDERTSERMRRINDAWHILSSPVRRRRYDVAAPQPMGWGLATQERANTYRATPPAQPIYRDSEGPGLAGALGILAVAWLVMGTILFGFLPLPFIGLALLFAGRTIVGGFLRR